MTDTYTPDEQELIEGSTVGEDERRRAIARIKAEAWDEGFRASRNGHSPYVNPYREEAGL